MHAETKGNEEGKVISEVVEHNSTIEEHVLMQLSFQTLHDSIGARTVRLGGMHRRKRLYILIDSQNTHNFLNEQASHKLGWPLKEVISVHVTIANG